MKFSMWQTSFLCNFFAAFSPELISLAITYVVSLGGMLQFCVRQSAEVESLVSILLIL